MLLSKTEGMVRVGLVAYLCTQCHAFQLHGGEFSAKGGVMPPTVCTIIRGSDGYICGAKMGQISTVEVLRMLNTATGMQDVGE